MRASRWDAAGSVLPDRDKSAAFFIAGGGALTSSPPRRVLTAYLEPRSWGSIERMGVMSPTRPERITRRLLTVFASVQSVVAGDDELGDPGGYPFPPPKSKKQTQSNFQGAQPQARSQRR